MASGPSPFRAAAGAQVAGYRLDHILGRGKYGEVWRASAGGATSALKFIRLGDKSGLREWSGVRRVRGIQHHNLMPMIGIWMLDHFGNLLPEEMIQLYDQARDAQTDSLALSEEFGLPETLVVQMLLADMNLQQKARQYGEAGGSATIPVNELLGYMRQAAAGIDFLNESRHDLGQGPQAIQHLDIKPANLVLRGDQVLVCDFGLAQTLRDFELTMTSTRGTYAYMSPECVNGKASQQSDQYSLACTYYHLRTDSLVIDDTASSEFEVMRMIDSGELELSALGGPERDVINRATAHDPRERFGSCSELVRELERAVLEASQPAMPATRPFQLKPGAQIAGYTLESFLGQGKYGEVWKASAGGAEAALKFIQLGGKSGFREWDAIRRVRGVSHRYLMPITGIWMLDAFGNVLPDDMIDRVEESSAQMLAATIRPEPQEGLPATLVIGMLYAPMNLSQKALEYDEQLPAIPAAELLDYMQQAAEGIDFLNEKRHDLGSGLQSIQHLDVKPDNIALRGDSALVCDFGLAQALGDVDLLMTSPRGSFAYMSPECLKGTASYRSDQYSLACTYYHLRTGELALTANSQAEIFRNIETGNLDLSKVTGKERSVLARAVSVDPEERYGSSAEMVAALRLAVDGRSPRRRIPPALVGALALALIVAGAAALFWRPVQGGGSETEFDQLLEKRQYGAALELVQQETDDRDVQRARVGAIVSSWSTAVENPSQLCDTLGDIRAVVEFADEIDARTDYDKTVRRWLPTGEMELAQATQLLERLSVDVHGEIREHVLERLESLAEQCAAAEENALAVRCYRKILAEAPEDAAIVQSATRGLLLQLALGGQWSSVVEELDAARPKLAGRDRALLQGLTVIAEVRTSSAEVAFDKVLPALLELTAAGQMFTVFGNQRPLADELAAARVDLIAIAESRRAVPGLTEEQIEPLDALTGGLGPIEDLRRLAIEQLEQGQFEAARATAAEAEIALSEASDTASAEARRLQLVDRFRAIRLRVGLRDTAAAAADPLLGQSAELGDLISEPHVDGAAILYDIIQRLVAETFRPSHAGFEINELTKFALEQTDARAIAGKDAEQFKEILDKLAVVRATIEPDFDFARAGQRVRQVEERGTAWDPTEPLDAALILARWECDLWSGLSAARPTTAETARQTLTESSDVAAASAFRSYPDLVGFFSGLLLPTSQVDYESSVALLTSISSRGAVYETLMSPTRRALAARLVIDALPSDTTDMQLGLPLSDDALPHVYQLLRLVRPAAEDASQDMQSELLRHLALVAYAHPDATAETWATAIDASDAFLERERSNRMLLVSGLSHKRRFDASRQATDAHLALRRLAVVCEDPGLRRNESRFYSAVLVPAKQVADDLMQPPLRAGVTEDEGLRADVAAIYAAFGELVGATAERRIQRKFEDPIAAARESLGVAIALDPDQNDYRLRSAEFLIEHEGSDRREKMEFVRDVAESVLQQDEQQRRAHGLMGWVRLNEAELYPQSQVLFRRERFRSSTEHLRQAVAGQRVSAPGYGMNSVFLSNALLLWGLTYRDAQGELQGKLADAQRVAESIVQSRGAVSWRSHIRAQMMLGNILEDLSQYAGRNRWRDAESVFRAALEDARGAPSLESRAEHNLGRCLEKRCRFDQRTLVASDREQKSREALELLRRASESEHLAPELREQAYFFQLHALVDGSRRGDDLDPDLRQEYLRVAERLRSLYSPTHARWATVQKMHIDALRVLSHVLNQRDSSTNEALVTEIHDAADAFLTQLESFSDTSDLDVTVPVSVSSVAEAVAAARGIPFEGLEEILTRAIGVLERFEADTGSEQLRAMATDAEISMRALRVRATAAHVSMKRLNWQDFDAKNDLTAARRGLPRLDGSRQLVQRAVIDSTEGFLYLLKARMARFRTADEQPETCANEAMKLLQQAIDGAATIRERFQLSSDVDSWRVYLAWVIKNHPDARIDAAERQRQVDELLSVIERPPTGDARQFYDRLR